MDEMEKELAKAAGTLAKDVAEDLVRPTSKSIGENISSRRIGMRYINKFSCPNIMSISKILSPLEAKAIKNAVSKDNIARAMMIHEFQCGTNIIRVQLGVPNKFYPSIINNYDIILDID